MGHFSSSLTNLLLLDFGASPNLAEHAAGLRLAKRLKEYRGGAAAAPALETLSTEYLAYLREKLGEEWPVLSLQLAEFRTATQATPLY